MFPRTVRLRVQRVALEHHGDVPVLRGGVGDVAPADGDRPSVTSSRPATMRSSVDLPHPDGPTSTSSSPSATSRSTSSHGDVPVRRTAWSRERMAMSANGGSSSGQELGDGVGAGPRRAVGRDPGRGSGRWHGPGQPMSTTTASGPGGQQLIELRGLPAVAVPVADRRRPAADPSARRERGVDVVPARQPLCRSSWRSIEGQRCLAGPRGRRRRRCRGGAELDDVASRARQRSGAPSTRRARREPPLRPTPRSPTGRARTSHRRGGRPAPLPRRAGPRRCTTVGDRGHDDARARGRAPPRPARHRGRAGRRRRPAPATAASPMERSPLTPSMSSASVTIDAVEAQLARSRSTEDPAAERGRRLVEGRQRRRGMSSPRRRRPR